MPCSSKKYKWFRNDKDTRHPNHRTKNRHIRKKIKNKQEQ